MADYGEKDVENARHVEDVKKSPATDASVGVGMTELKTLDNPDLAKEDALLELPDAERKRILRKVDLRVVPMLTFLYLVAFIDRSNSMLA